MWGRRFPVDALSLNSSYLDVGGLKGYRVGVDSLNTPLTASDINKLHNRRLTVDALSSLPNFVAVGFDQTSFAVQVSNLSLTPAYHQVGLLKGYEVPVDLLNLPPSFIGVGLRKDLKLPVAVETATPTFQAINFKKGYTTSVAVLNQSVTFRDVGKLHNRRLAVATLNVPLTFVNTDGGVSAHVVAVDPLVLSPTFKDVAFNKTRKGPYGSLNLTTSMKDVQFRRARHYGTSILLMGN